jgi:hypothetical protein
MNKKQVIVLLSAVLLFSFSELFRPWYYEDNSASVRKSAGYHFRAPALKSPAEMSEMFFLSDTEPPRHFTVGVDRMRLYSQRIILTLLLLGLLLLLEERGSALRTVAGASIFLLGLFALAVYAYEVPC